MTFEELNSVRQIKRQLTDENQRLAMLKICAESITPKLDGLPHGTVKASKVEFIGIAIVDTEGRIAEMQNALNDAVISLTEKLNAEVKEFSERLLLAYRYVACKTFKETARLMGCSRSTILRRHDKALKVLGLKIFSENNLK